MNLRFDGEPFNRYIEYDSHNEAKFKMDLKKLAWEIVELSNSDGEGRRCDIEVFKSNILRVNKFWYENIFVPVSELIILPQHNTCYCFKGHCAYDLFHSSHHVKDGAKVKVDIFTCPPTISINVATQSVTDVEKLKDFYVHTIKKFRQNPCCQCVPISKELLTIVGSMISVIENVLDEVAEEAVRVEHAVIV